MFDMKTYEKLSAPFDSIKEREGHKGAVYLYIAVTDIVKRLNDVFGLNWNFEILREEVHYDNEQYNVTRRTVLTNPARDNEPEKIDEKIINESKQRAKNITTLGRISIKDSEGNVWIKEAWGSQEIKWRTDDGTMLNLGNDKKGAASDALKKCAELMGVALDISLMATKEQIQTIISLFKSMNAPNIPEHEELMNMSGLEALKLISELKKRIDA
jgi:hypothetical protein